MPHVAARVLPAAILVAVAMVLFSAASVFAKDPDNPNGSHDGLYNNPGHHYGQLKHQTPSPVPTPAPTPAPAQAPVPASPEVTSHPASVPSPQSQPRAASQIPDVPVTLPAQPSGQVSVTETRPAGDGLWWLLLLILPLLLAIWVLVATRMAVTAVRKLRTVKQPAAQMAAATS